VFATLSQFHPSLIFMGKARSLVLEWRHVKGYTLAGSYSV